MFIWIERLKTNIMCVSESESATGFQGCGATLKRVFFRISLNKTAGSDAYRFCKFTNLVCKFTNLGCKNTPSFSKSVESRVTVGFSITPSA